MTMVSYALWAAMVIFLFILKKDEILILSIGNVVDKPVLEEVQIFLQDKTFGRLQRDLDIFH